MSKIRLFAHRGFTKNNFLPENSLASLESAIINQFNGVEFDIWAIGNPRNNSKTVLDPDFSQIFRPINEVNSSPFNAENTDFQKNFQKNFQREEDSKYPSSDLSLVISHNLPKIDEISLLPNLEQFLQYGSNPKLSKSRQEIQSLEPNFTYWLDFKNADSVDSRILAKQVFEILQKFSIHPKQAIIAPFLTNLNKLEKVLENFLEIFGENLSFAGVCEEESKIDEVVNFLSKNRLKLLSIDYRIINSQNFFKISAFELLAWTVNDLVKMKDLIDLGVKNFATDLITNRELQKSYEKPKELI